MSVNKKDNSPAPEVKLVISNTEFVAKLKIRINEDLIALQNIVTSSDIEVARDELRDWSEYNVELLKRCFNNPINEYVQGYEQAGESFFGSLGEAPNNPKQTLLNQLDYKTKYLKRLCNRAELIKSEVAEPANAIDRVVTSPSHSKSNEIFIVHGHDNAAKLNVARFLEHLELKPIILNEQSNSGRTIIEKIEIYTNVGFAVVLYTECDFGGKNADSLLPRARQNVVFEHGYLMGKIGRSNVCALVKGNVETPSDISGVVYTPMDEHGAWHYRLAKELKASDYNIDMNKL